MYKTNARSSRNHAASQPDPDLLHRNLSTAVIAFHEAVARKSGMGISEHKCLGALYLLGPVTAGALARETGFTTGAITGIVDRLEKAGHVRREPNPEDRRSVIIRLTGDDKKRQRSGQLFQSLTDAMTRLRSDYSEAELATIYGYLMRTTEILKEEARKLEQGGT
jgi:DNA-binding MarR family transcriptional regulator